MSNAYIKCLIQFLYNYGKHLAIYSLQHHALHECYISNRTIVALWRLTFKVKVKRYIQDSSENNLSTVLKTTQGPKLSFKNFSMAKRDLKNAFMHGRYVAAP